MDIIQFRRISALTRQQVRRQVRRQVNKQTKTFKSTKKSLSRRTFSKCRFCSAYALRVIRRSLRALQQSRGSTKSNYRSGIGILRKALRAMISNAFEYFRMLNSRACTFSRLSLVSQRKFLIENFRAESYQ